MRMIWFIALGGAAGSVARYLLGTAIQRHGGVGFPLGTLAVNVSGSFLVGVLMRYAIATPAISPEVRALLTVGLCGGYTTFSTFTYETVALLEDGDWRRAGWYVVLSVAVSLAATVLGLLVAREILVLRRGL
jgi:CrcB protein